MVPLLVRDMYLSRIVFLFITGPRGLWSYNSCHFVFSEEKGDYYPKLWYFKPRGTKFPKEIFKGIDINDSIVKLFLTPLHILNIINFDSTDSGIYVCLIPGKKNISLPFIYILEGKQKR